MPSNVSGRVALTLLLCGIAPGRPEAQPRTAVVQSVDLSVPMPPVTLSIAGRTHLVHELHVTNFLSVDVSLTRLEVTSTASPDVSIADYRDAELADRVGRPGRPRTAPNPHVVGPGMRAVVYLWIPLPEGSPTPRAVQHRLGLEVLRETERVPVQVDSLPSPVPSEAAVVLDPPLRGGPWVAIYDPALRGGHRTAIYTVGGRARIPARFAIDWVRLPPSSVMEPGERPGADWNGYGAEVLAVGDGVIAAAMDDIPENEPTPGTAPSPMPLSNASGNYLALELGRGRFAFYEHLKRGTLRVKAGDRVRSGQVIAQLGNSGSSSIGPHLHFHLSDANSPLAAEGLPFVFARFEHRGAFESIRALTAGERWVPNPAGFIAARRRERPGPNAVVWFE